MYLTLSFLLCLGLPLVLPSCQIGWTEFKEDCIWFSQRQRAWQDAESDCRAKGAWLLSDDNQPKHDFLAIILNVLRDRGMSEWFIGATDYAFEGSFRWLETGAPLSTFTKWGTGQPNGTAVENCLSLKWEGRNLVWEDEKCSNRGKRADTAQNTTTTHKPHPTHPHHHPHVHVIPHGIYYYICETRYGPN